jgi:N6-adenosine-specific RNA methylase IME4
MKVPRDKQKSFLNQIGVGDDDADVEPKAAKKAVREARRKARAKKHGIPANPLAPANEADKYMVVRVTPDWLSESMDDLKALPVGDFLIDDGVVCVVAPNYAIGDAAELIMAWKFHIRGIMTVHDGQMRDNSPYEMFAGLTWHMLVGTRHKKQRINTAYKINPVACVEDPAAEAIMQTSMLFATNLKMDGRRLDISATEDDHDGDWVTWKKKYGDAGSGAA